MNNELLDDTIKKINAGEAFTPISSFKNDDERARYFAAIASNERRLMNAARAREGASEAAKSEAARQRVIDQQRNEALSKWKAAGGDEATFAATWPQIYQQMLISAATTKPTAPAFNATRF